MSDSQKKLQSINPNVPKNPHWLYSDEKANFAGILIGSVLYGTQNIPTFTSTYLCSLSLFDYSRNSCCTVLQMHDHAA